jgi:hypothetical protein
MALSIHGRWGIALRFEHGEEVIGLVAPKEQAGTKSLYGSPRT